MRFMNNRFLKIIFSAIKAIITLFIVGVFSIIFLQRVSNNSVNLAGYGLYTIVSESMLPKYKVYDMIFVKQVDPSAINIGDDVVYEGKEGSFEGKIITHQVIQKRFDDGQYKFITKGLNNTIEDAEISETQLMGKVLGKSVILSFISKIINNIYGFYFVVFVPMVVLVFLDIVDAINERRKLKKELDD